MATISFDDLVPGNQQNTPAPPKVVGISFDDLIPSKSTASIATPVEGTGGAAFGVFRRQDKPFQAERQARIEEEKFKRDENKTPFAQLYQDPDTFKKINDYAIARFGKTGLQRPNESKEDYVSRWVGHMRSIQSNVKDGTTELMYLNSAPQENLLKAKEAYDLFENTASAFSPKGQQGAKPILDYLGAIASDPTTYASLGIGAVAKTAFLKSAAQIGLKATLASRLGATAAAAVPAFEGVVGASSSVIGKKRELTTDAAKLRELKEVLPTLTPEEQAYLKPDIDALEANIKAGVSGTETALAFGLGAAGGTVETGALLLAARAAKGSKPLRLQDILESKKKPVETVSPKVEVKATDPTEKALEDVYDIFEGRKLLNAQGEPTPIAEMQIRNDVNKKATEIAQNIWKQLPEFAPQEGEKVSDAVKRVFDNLETLDPKSGIGGFGQVQIINKEIFENALVDAGTTAEQFALMMRTTVADAARTMQSYSVLSKLLNKTKSIDKAAAKQIDLMYGDRNAITSAFTGLWDMSTRFDRNLKGLMVSQLSTTIRNGFSSLAVVTVGTASEAIESALYRVGKTAYELGSGKPLTGSFTGGVKGVYEDAVRTIFYLGENGLASDTAEALLASSPSLKNRILRTAGETGVNELAKPVQIMNTLNVAQDAFFRKVIFTSSVEKQLSRVGLNLYDVMAEGKNVPFDVLKNATDEALAATFSKMPTQGPLFHAVKLVEELGIAGSVALTPFPRFMANAMTWGFKHSPLGIGKGSANIGKGAFMLAKGDEMGQKYLTQGLEDLSKGVVGSYAIYSAYKYREENQDTTWYDVKNPDGSLVDARALFPLGPVLALGDYWVKFNKGRIDEFKTKEFVEAISGLKVPAGTYSLIGDKIAETWANSQTGEDSAERKISTFFGELVGEYLGRALVPAQQISDFIGAIDRDETLPRDAYQVKPGEEGFLTSAQQQLMKRTPILKQQLPEFQPATREQAPFDDSGLLKMFSGIKIKQFNTPVEEEITRLKVPYNKIFTSTGDKIVDASARKVMAPLLVQTFDVVKDTDFYRQAGQDTQKIVMQNLLGWVQKNAKDIAVKTSEAEAFAEGKQARLFEVKYSALAPEVKRATAEFYKQNMKQDLAETKDYVSALAIAAALKKQPGFAVGGVASKLAGEVMGTTLKKSASELLQEAKALAAKNVSTTEAVAPAVQQTKTMLAPTKKAAPQPVVEAAPTPVAPAVAEPAPNLSEIYSPQTMQQAESLLKTQMGSQYQLDKYKAAFPQEYQNSLLTKLKEISTEAISAPALPPSKLSKEELQKADDALLAEDKAKKDLDVSTVENLNKPKFAIDSDRMKQTISKIKDIRTTAFDALKQFPQIRSISDDAIAVAQGDYRMMKKREVNLTDPADINEFASFAAGYQKRLDALREQYKDRPPVRLYHGSTTERTPEKLKRGFFDPQGIDDKKHMELDIGATSFTKDLRLNYSNIEFGGGEPKNISFTEIPYADYLFRKVDMPLSSYQKKDMNVLAQVVTGSPNIARPLGLPRSLGFRETEDAFVESEKLAIKQDKETVQKTFNLFKKQEEVSAALQNKLETISNKYDMLAGPGKQQTLLANEAYKNIRLLMLNEFRQTGGKTALKEGMIPSFESNQTTINRLRLLNKSGEYQFSMQDLLAKTAKALQQAGSTDKAEALLELKKNLKEISTPGPYKISNEYEAENVKKMTEAVNSIRRLVGGEERVIQKLEGAEGPASQYPKNVKRLGLAKGGLASRRA